MTKKFPLTNWSEKKAFTIKLGAVKKYHIAVFADPNCPWCKRFFEENLFCKRPTTYLIGYRICPRSWR